MISYKAIKLIMNNDYHYSHSMVFVSMIRKKNYCVLKGICTEVNIEYIYTVRTVYSGIHTFDRLIKQIT